ncbi:MAG: SUMO-activating enzyme subunit 1 [Benjaminiella poitrasii]|nr:MAG: SUMO-activating enzyme subunit 1 [Benjaminiella poitrasii]
MTAELSKDEAAIYDRQIRLWGFDAQQRIGKADILIAGMRALSDEVCKNLALAGVASITLLDHEIVTEVDLGAQFFLTKDNIGQNRAEAAAASIRNLNPRVKVVVDQQNIKEKPSVFFESFSVVCLIHSDYELMVQVDKIRRKVKKPFYAADAFGWFGYIFCDLTEHSYIQEKKTNPRSDAKALPSVKKIPCIETYSSLLESLQKNWSDTRIKIIKRRTSPMAFLINILLQFQKEYRRCPTKEDEKLLIENKAKYLSDMGINDFSVLEDDLIREMISLYDTELSAVSAIVGGILAQDILRTLSANELPIQNWFYYNGLDGSGLVHKA